MKNIVIILFMVISLFASQISWYGDYDKALNQARKEHKNLMVLLIRDNSKTAKSVLKRVFMNQAYIKQISKNFISVIVIYKKSVYPIEMFYTTNFPRLFFVSSDDELFLDDSIIDISPTELSDKMEMILN